MSTDNTEKTAKKRQRFFELLAEGLSATGAAMGAGFDRSTAYRWRHEDPDFAAGWDAAVESGTDVMEDIAHERAKNMSDTLMIFLLKSRRREKYSELSRTRITGADDGPVQVEQVQDERKPIADFMIEFMSKKDGEDGN